LKLTWGDGKKSGLGLHPQSAQENEMNALCEAHPALDRFVQLLARIAQGIQSGAITVPR